MYKLTLLFTCFLLFVSCSKDNIIDPVQFDFDFSTDLEEWQAEFADYPEGEESFYELEFEHSMLPSPLDESQGSIKQSGNNRSDDLFMFLKKKLTGLVPNQTYKAFFEIQIATNVATGSVGVGGSPGESVYIKAGITQNEPLKQLNDSAFYRMNIDIGSQANSGQDMVVLGDFANGTDYFDYELKELANTKSFNIQADGNGELWLVVGTDSAFESTTTIFYNKISVTLE